MIQLNALPLGVPLPAVPLPATAPPLAGPPLPAPDLAGLGAEGAAFLGSAAAFLASSAFFLSCHQPCSIITYTLQPLFMATL